MNILKKLYKLINNFNVVLELNDENAEDEYLDHLRLILDYCEGSGYDVSQQKRDYFKLEFGRFENI